MPRSSNARPQQQPEGRNQYSGVDGHGARTADRGGRGSGRSSGGRRLPVVDAAPDQRPAEQPRDQISEWTREHGRRTSDFGRDTASCDDSFMASTASRRG